MQHNYAIQSDCLSDYISYDKPTNNIHVEDYSHKKITISIYIMIKSCINIKHLDSVILVCSQFSRIFNTFHLSCYPKVEIMNK